MLLNASFRLPVKQLFSTNNLLKKGMTAKVVDNDPVNRLSFTMISAMLMEPLNTSMKVPINRLNDNSSFSRKINEERQDGIEPVRSLLLKKRLTSDCIVDIVDGIVPLS